MRATGAGRDGGDLDFRPLSGAGRGPRPGPARRPPRHGDLDFGPAPGEGANGAAPEDRFDVRERRVPRPARRRPRPGRRRAPHGSRGQLGDTSGNRWTVSIQSPSGSASRRASTARSARGGGRPLLRPARRPGRTGGTGAGDESGGSGGGPAVRLTRDSCHTMRMRRTVGELR